MFWKSRKAEQTTESQKEVKARKSRFQIVKLEERIAPGSAKSSCHMHGTLRHPRYHGGGNYCGGGV